LKHQADKKRILNLRLFEVNLLKYNSELLRELIKHNEKNSDKVNNEDKIKFPFICVEFPSYKKSEVNKKFSLKKFFFNFFFKNLINY